MQLRTLGLYEIVLCTCTIKFNFAIILSRKYPFLRFPVVLIGQGEFCTFQRTVFRNLALSASTVVFLKRKFQRVADCLICHGKLLHGVVLRVLYFMNGLV